MEYGVLLRDNIAAAGDDLDIYSVVVVVEADNRIEAARKARALADESGLEMELHHAPEGRHLGGHPAYVIVRTREQLRDAARRIKQEHHQPESDVGDMIAHYKSLLG